jgi:hypothetical protein
MAATLDNFRNNIGILARAVNDHSKQIKEYDHRFRMIESIKAPTNDFDEKVIQLKNDIFELRKQIVSEERIKLLITEILNNILNTTTPLKPVEEIIGSEVSSTDITTIDDISIVPSVNTTKKGRGRKKIA